MGRSKALEMDVLGIHSHVQEHLVHTLLILEWATKVKDIVMYLGHDLCHLGLADSLREDGRVLGQVGVVPVLGVEDKGLDVKGLQGREIVDSFLERVHLGTLKERNIVNGTLNA